MSASAPAVADDQQQWQKELTVALRGAEPRLSVWLEHVLEGIEEVGDPLWERLRFFFDALDAPKDEAESFIAKFADWLEEMEYDYVSDSVPSFSTASRLHLILKMKKMNAPDCS